MSYHRQIKTTAERRANEGHKADGLPFGRAARMGHNLRNSWDDIQKGKPDRKTPGKTKSDKRRGMAP